MSGAVLVRWQDLPLEDLAQVLVPHLAAGEVENARLVCKAWRDNLNRNICTVKLHLSKATNTSVVPWNDLPSRFPVLKCLSLRVGTSCSRDALRSLLEDVLDSGFKTRLQQFKMETVGPVCLTPNWQLLSMLPKLTSFYLKEADGQSCQVWDAKGLSLLTRLTSLSWHGSSNLPVHFWGAIAALTGLEALSISHFGQNFNGSQSVDDATNVLCTLPNLTHLDVSHLNSNLPVASLTMLLSIPTLKSISLGVQNSAHAQVVCSLGRPVLPDSHNSLETEPHNLVVHLDQQSPNSEDSGTVVILSKPSPIKSIQLHLSWPATQNISCVAQSVRALRSLTSQHMALDCASVDALSRLTGLTELHLLRFIPMHEPEQQGCLSNLSTLTALETCTLASDHELFLSTMRLETSNIQPDFSTHALKHLAATWFNLRALRLEMELGNFSGDLITALKEFKALKELTLVVVPITQQVQAFRRVPTATNNGGFQCNHLAVTLPDLPADLTSLHLGGVVVLPMAMKDAIDLAGLEEAKVQSMGESSATFCPCPHPAIDYVCPLSEANDLARPSPDVSRNFLAAQYSMKSTAFARELVHLRLECCCVDDDVISLLCSTAVRLQHLTLINNTGLSRQALSHLSNLQMLQELTVCDNPSAVITSLQDVFGAGPFRTAQVDIASLDAVRWLRNLRRLSWTVEDAICNFVHVLAPLAMLKSLEHLRLSCIWNPKGDIKSKCEHLVKLQLPRCAVVELVDVQVSPKAAEWLLEEKKKMQQAGMKSDGKRLLKPCGSSHLLRPASPANSPRGGLMRKISRTLKGLK